MNKSAPFHSSSDFKTREGVERCGFPEIKLKESGIADEMCLFA
jgi:hypothetical protein